MRPPKPIVSYCAFVLWIDSGQFWDFDSLTAWPDEMKDSNVLNNVDVSALLWKDLENAEISKDGIVCYRLPRNIVEV